MLDSLPTSVTDTDNAEAWTQIHRRCREPSHWVKHWRSIKWDTSFSSSYCIQHHTISQTLATLSLLSNDIRDAGAKSLAEALKINQVRRSAFFLMIHWTSLFLTDSHRTGSWRQCYRHCRSTVTCWNFDEQPSETWYILLHDVFNIILSYRPSRD